VAAVQFAVSLVLDILVWLVVDRIFLSIEYWQSSKYSLIIAPLNFRGREYTAGIAGHRQGTVVTLGGDDIPNASSDDFTQQIKQIREAGKQAEDEYKGKQPNTNNEELAPQGARGGTKSLPPSTSKQPADTSKPVPVKSGQYVRPGNGPTTSSFGVNRGDHIHQGIDIGVPEGSAIRAISDGYVEALGTQIGSSGRGYGNWLAINHDDGTAAGYAHLQNYEFDPTTMARIRRGEKVRIIKGQVVARSGVSGAPGQPHLHFEAALGPNKVLSGLSGDTVDPCSTFGIC